MKYENEIFKILCNWITLFKSKTEQIIKYATPNQYNGIAYIAKRLPIKTLIKRKITGVIKISDLWKLKQINIIFLYIQSFSNDF